MRTLDTKIPAPVVALIIGILTKWYAYSASILIDPTPTRMQIGVGLAQISGVIALVAMACFWHARTTINPLDPRRASQLVTSGIFRWSRNPMYLSLLLLLVAYAIRLDSFAVWIGPIAFVAYVTRFQILPEERVLAEKFGDAYVAYKDRTRRWI
ncbi:methyltransferase family protein [Oxalicibacterium flavum]|nr:isoprenylcysteine carboxylmethyltransferase family protein [Oxalicibacterium flavum]